MSTVISVTGDEIDVVHEVSGVARIRVREHASGSYASSKASIFLAPAQLEEHALACLKLAAEIRAKR